MSPAAKIGLLTLIGLIVLAVFIIKIEDIPVTEQGKRQLVKAEFASVAGLDRKAPVRIAGVRVGKVEKVGLAGGKALVTMSLSPDVELFADATARIAQLGMLGDSYIELDPGTPSAGPLPPERIIPGTSPPGFDRIMDLASQIGADIKELSYALQKAAGGEEGAEKLQEIVDNIRDLSADLERLIEENQANVNQTTENFREFSTTLRDELPRIAEKLHRLADSLQKTVDENSPGLKGSLENIRQLSKKLQVTADNLNEITGKIRRGEGTVGKLVNDETTVNKVNKALDSVAEGANAFKETFGRVQRYRLDMTVYAASEPSADGARSGFGFDLWTSNDRFVRVELVDTPYGRTKSKTETVTTVYDDGTTESYTRTITKTDDTGSVTAQLGYRLFPNTVVRAGLIESHGGIGIDQEMEVGKRRLKLSLEAFDFDRDEASAPHIRLEGRLFFGRNIFLLAGWDDPAYSENSSVLLGAGITWTDEDMKYLLGLASKGL